MYDFRAFGEMEATAEVEHAPPDVGLGGDMRKFK